MRVDQHYTKLLPFQYNVVYEPGKMTPCDCGSCHQPPNTDFTEEERVDWAIKDETDIFINQGIQDQLPQAVTLEILRAATATDPDLQLLISASRSNWVSPRRPRGSRQDPKPAKTVLLVSKHGTISKRICQNMPSMCCSSVPHFIGALETQTSTRMPIAKPSCRL